MPIKYKFEPSEMDLTNGEYCADPWADDEEKSFYVKDPKNQILYQFVRHVKVHPIYQFNHGHDGQDLHPLDSSFLVKSPAEMYRAIYDFEAYFQGISEDLGFEMSPEIGSDNGFFPLQERDKERAKWTSEDAPVFKGFFVQVALNHEMDYLEAAMPELHGIHWTCSHSYKELDREFKETGSTIYVKQFQVYDWAKSEEAIVDTLKGIYKCMLNELY